MVCSFCDDIYTRTIFHDTGGRLGVVLNIMNCVFISKALNITD